MGNHIQDILSHWYPNRDSFAWVLGTVISTEGSSYRKAGAMMMFNSRGEFFGLLSGGCLEKALFIDVKKVISLGQARVVEFDSTADTDVAWQLGLGCGGKVRILLQPVHRGNHYQSLDDVLSALNKRKTINYAVMLADSGATFSGRNFIETDKHRAQMQDESVNELLDSNSNSDLISNVDAGKLPAVLTVALRARRQLIIFGGGVDVLPMVPMAKALGWHLSIVDHRVGYAQAQHFAGADRIIREPADHADVQASLDYADAAFVMTHNIQLDALALSILLPSKVQYIGLLGPAHRKHRVLVKAGLKSDTRIHGPMGIDLGGELPESIALAALAQCHKILESEKILPARVEERELRA